jgi:hypothetical protein
MADRKVHHFCFAYRGDQMRTSPFEALHFFNVQGTSTLDGLQLVRISLKRGNGRRESTIPRIIQEYNSLSEAEPITPCPFASCTIHCFKTTNATNSSPIIRRIEADRLSSSRYWSWDAIAEEGKPTKGAFSGLESLVRELNLNPSTLHMKSAYDHVSKAYFQVHGKALRNSGAFPAKDRDFILQELRKHFDRERMYVVSPNVSAELTPAAKALTTPCFMDDVRFNAASDTRPGNVPNETVLRYFAGILSDADKEDVTVSFQDILIAFNSTNAGMYRRSCILPFMSPFLESRAVESVDETHLLIHTQKVARQISRLETTKSDGR